MRKNVADEVGAANQEIADHLVHESGIDERAVACDFDDHVCFARLRCLHYTIEYVILASPKCMGSHTFRCRGDCVIRDSFSRRNDDLVNRSRQFQPLDHAAQHRLAEYRHQDFPGKPG